MLKYPDFSDGLHPAYPTTSAIESWHDMGYEPSPVAAAPTTQWGGGFGSTLAAPGAMVHNRIDPFDRTYESMTWYGMPASSPALDEYEH